MIYFLLIFVAPAFAADKCSLVAVILMQTEAVIAAFI